MKIEDFLKIIEADFYTGVPDSLLKPLCNYLYKTYGENNNHHVIAANEGNAVGIAAGYYLATNKIPVVYMQNSGEGNIVNPVTSLLSEKVYGIPMIFIIGWRGEPGVHDEPQHAFQGEITTSLLDVMHINYIIIEKETEVSYLEEKFVELKNNLAQGNQIAFVIKKGALEYEPNIDFKNDYDIIRERILESILNITRNDIIVSTTGKTSREIFEIREKNSQSHKTDFLTVGSMGHTSSIAMGVAIEKPNIKVWCIDGDGSCIMHMGAMATIGKSKLHNLVHIVLNNEAHESVGGFPTAANSVNICEIAKSCGYEKVLCINSLEQIEENLLQIKNENKLTFIEIKTAIGSREDLGRPTISAIDNKNAFMKYIKEGF